MDTKRKKMENRQVREIMVKSIKKVRRCEEHKMILVGRDICPFSEHNPNNKIEEMTEQKAKALEWLEMNAKVEQWENSKERKTQLWISTPNHPQTKVDYWETLYFNPSKQGLDEAISNAFGMIADLIVKQLNKQVKIDRGAGDWVFKKTVYEMCPNAICGDNPCSCKDDKN